jgi:hypothetical protein
VLAQKDAEFSQHLNQKDAEFNSELAHHLERYQRETAALQDSMRQTEADCSVQLAHHVQRHQVEVARLQEKLSQQSFELVTQQHEIQRLQQQLEVAAARAKRAEAASAAIRWVGAASYCYLLGFCLLREGLQQQQQQLQEAAAKRVEVCSAAVRRVMTDAVVLVVNTVSVYIPCGGGASSIGFIGCGRQCPPVGSGGPSRSLVCCYQVRRPLFLLAVNAVNTRPPREGGLQTITPPLGRQVGSFAAN